MSEYRSLELSQISLHQDIKDWLFASPRSIPVTIYVLSVWQQGGEAETPSLVPAHPGDLIEQSYPETGIKTSDLYRTKNIPERFNHPGSSQSIFVKECDLQKCLNNDGC